ncbi:MAG: N-acetylmuramoyl-L-alanine amidase [Bacteroidales bacterium]|nr:N-acetylmuramoyl-L-alanine amidase [Bacteroidales bacterium]
MIEQSEWREGLSDPSYERVYTDVHNIIVHHSAGSNIDTNYTGIVRNIYIYHTEIRGWSDIGYNYLLAPDGTIFKGRDPGNLEQDNVKGAHFCAANSGTMGICVMGTYIEVSPSQAALASLISLMNWKLGKDSLDPLGIYTHVLNSALPVIAGHRDGCATECPGEVFYHLLDSIRQEVQKAFNACGYEARPVETAIRSYVSPALTISYASQYISIQFNEGQVEQFKLYDMLGHEVSRFCQQVTQSEVLLSRGALASGIYLVSIILNDTLYTDKLMLF